MYKLNIDKSMGVATNLIVGRVQDLPYEKFSFKVYDKTEIIDLTGAIIEFRGVNAIGGKIVQMDVKITNAKAGEFEFEVPKVFYSTMGKFTNAYFLIKREGRADSTEDLLINVLSGTEVSKEDAQIVIDGLDKVITDTIEKVSKDLKIKIDKQISDMNVKITKLDGDVKRIDKVVKDAEVKMNKLIVDTTSNIEQLKKDFEAKLTQLDLKIVDFDKSIVAFEKRLQDLTALIDSKNLITQEDIDRMGFVTNTQLISKKYVTESQLTSKNYVNNQELINMRFVKHSEMGNLLHNYPTTGFLRKNPVNDLNELKESGLFTFDVATKNVPTTGFLTVTCKMRNNTSGSQIAESVGEVGGTKIWNRTIVNGSWSQWVPLHAPKLPYARFIMHRGYHGETNMYPENSIRSFEGANGNFGVETDVRVTKDNKLICMHDATINRTTTGTGNVADLTLAQIRNFNLKTKFSPSDTAENDQKVPTLEEYLDINVRNGTVPFIEIKGFSKASDYDLLAKMIKEYNLEDTCYVISFNEVDLTNMRTRLPRVKLQFLGIVINDANILKVKDLYPCDVSVNHSKLTQSEVDLVHSHALAISVWTVNKEEDIRKMHQMGVDFISSDITRANNRVWRAVKADEYIDGVEIVQDNAMAYFIIRELNNGTASLETVIRGLVGKELPPQAILVKNLPEWATPKDREVWSCSGLGRRDKSTEHEVNGINLVKSSGLGGRGWVTAGFALKGLSWLGVRATYSIGNY